MTGRIVTPYDAKAADRYRATLAEIDGRLRTSGVIYFDSADDFGYEFLLRDLYLPHSFDDKESPSATGWQKFGLFLGWQFSIDTAGAFLDAIVGEAQIVAWRFLHLDHQAGGHACIGRSFIVTPVRLCAGAVAIGQEIARHYYFSCLTSPDQTHASSGLAYPATMAGYGISVDQALTRSDSMMESIYPIDASAANMALLAAEPERHFQWIEPLMKSGFLAKRLSLFLIADNCD